MLGPRRICKGMLPLQISSELFNIRNRVSDIIIEYIVDELWKYGFTVTRIDNCDTYVYIDFENRKGVTGELKIDRFNKEFNISAKDGDTVIMPMFGDWTVVLKYLTSLAVGLVTDH